MDSKQKRPPQQPSLEGLPEHLGFGRLDRASVRDDGSFVSALYLHDNGDTAYTVDWNPGRCLLKAQFEGRTISMSGGRDLQAAFFQSMLANPEPTKDPRLLHLCQEVMESGNVYFRFPNSFRRRSPALISYPAGLLFGLRLPVNPQNRSSWDVFRTVLEKGNLPLRLLAERRGAIFTLSVAGGCRVEKISLIDFIAPLHDLVATCRLCANHELMAPGKVYRLAVMDAQLLALGALQVYEGEPERGTRAFAIWSDHSTSEAERDATSTEMLKRFMDLASRDFGPAT